MGDIDAELAAVEVEKQQKEVALEEVARRISKGKVPRVVRQAASGGQHRLGGQGCRHLHTQSMLL